MANTPYEIALQLCENGFCVVPSGGGNDGKHPIYSWKEYEERKSVRRELENWQFKDKPKLWGIVTGAISGVVVVEADTAEARAERQADSGQPPHVISPRGGAHWYFRHPGHHVKTGAGILPGVDTRGDGGFVNIAGASVFGEYQILTLPHPDNLIPWSRLPARILTALNSDTTAPTQQAKSPDKKIPYHQRNDYLFRLASSLRAKGLSEATILDSVRSAYENDCDHCDSDGKPVPMDDKELRTITKQGARYKPGIPLPKAPEYKPKENDGVSLVCMADVEPETVSWLWYPYIPKGKVTLLDGDPGIGKSWSSLAIATAVSLGKGLPGAESVESGSVVILSAEDGLGDTIRPRLDAMGANVKQIHAVRMRGRSLDFGAGDLTILETLIERVKPSLVIIDPLMAYLGAGVDAHRANETRVVMTKLADIAESQDCSILVIRHLTKGGTLKPIYRGLGSIDFAAAVRSMLLAGCDPDNPEKQGIVHIKCNNANRGKAIGYEIRDDNFYWTGESDLTAARILAADNGTRTSELDEAIEFLKDELAEGAVEVKKVESNADKAGINQRTLRRARESIGVKVKRQSEPGGKRGSGRWLWQLPESLADQEYQDDHDDHIKKNGQLNQISFENTTLPKTDGQVSTEAVLGMPIERALEIWRSEGALVIHLGPGENCLDLEKLLSRLDVKPEHLLAVADWLRQRGGQ